MKDVYSLVKKFKEKYPSTIVWRLKSHSKVVEKHLNPDEEVLYAFAGRVSWYSGYSCLFHLSRTGPLPSMAEPFLTPFC